MSEDDDAWFAPARFGYGSGLPIAPQGWLVLAIYLTLAIGCAYAAETTPALALPLMGGIFLPATLLFVIVSRRRTRGGWRWRWGEED